MIDALNRMKGIRDISQAKGVQIASAAIE